MNDQFLKLEHVTYVTVMKSYEILATLQQQRIQESQTPKQFYQTISSSTQILSSKSRRVNLVIVVIADAGQPVATAAKTSDNV